MWEYLIFRTTIPSGTSASAVSPATSARTASSEGGPAGGTGWTTRCRSIATGELKEKTRDSHKIIFEFVNEISQELEEGRHEGLCQDSSEQLEEEEAEPGMGSRSSQEIMKKIKLLFSQVRQRYLCPSVLMGEKEKSGEHFLNTHIIVLQKHFES